MMLSKEHSIAKPSFSAALTTALCVATVTTLLAGISHAATTVTGLTVEDVSTGSSSVVYNGNFTVVQWEGFEAGGTAGNTVNTSTGDYFSHTSQGHDGLFWRRLNQGIPPNWVGLGGNNQRYRAESDGSIDPTDPAPQDTDGIAQNTTTITGLDASRTYDFFYIAGGRIADTRNYLADFGTSATTARSADLDLLHLVLGDDPLSNSSVLGFYAVPIGGTGGVTSVQVSLESNDGNYWVGVGYVDTGAIPEPATSVLAVIAGFVVFGSRRRRS